MDSGRMPKKRRASGLDEIRVRVAEVDAEGDRDRSVNRDTETLWIAAIACIFSIFVLIVMFWINQ